MNNNRFRMRSRIPYALDRIRESLGYLPQSPTHEYTCTRSRAESFIEHKHNLHKIDEAESLESFERVC